MKYLCFLFSALVLLAMLTAPSVTLANARKDYQRGVAAYEAKNYSETVKWWRKAAHQGHIVAQFFLGYMYSTGEGAEKDSAEAAKWYRKSAEQGYPDAQFNLGLIYAEGEGIFKDTVSAHMWWNIAASNGNRNAAKNRDTIEKSMTPEDISEATKKAKLCLRSNYKNCE